MSYSEEKEQSVIDKLVIALAASEEARKKAESELTLSKIREENFTAAFKERDIYKQRAEAAEQRIKESQKQLAATQHVLVQMREAVSNAKIELVSDDGVDNSAQILSEAISLQVSTDALDEYRKSVLEEAAIYLELNWTHYVDGTGKVIKSMAAEFIRRMAYEHKQGE